MPTLRQAVVMDKIRVGVFRPATRGGIELIWKDAYGCRELDTFRSKKGELAFPVQTSGRHRRVRQPVQRHIVKNVVTRESLGVPVEHTCNQSVASIVVVEHPRR